MDRYIGPDKTEILSMFTQLEWVPDLKESGRLGDEGREYGNNTPYMPSPTIHSSESLTITAPVANRQYTFTL